MPEDTIWSIWQREEDTGVAVWAEPEGRVMLQVDAGGAGAHCRLSPEKARALAAELVRLAATIEGDKTDG
jgi:chitinase